MPFTACSERPSSQASQSITSAMMNPFSKSVWIRPAAFGAVEPRLMIHAWK